MSAPLPDDLLGIWRRDSVELAGAPELPSGPFEAADVLWFQARTRYADLRRPTGAARPFAEEEAFGGSQHYAAPRLRFHHELDRSGRLADDEGELALAGDLLVETGTFRHGGRTCRYVERWSRCSPRDASIAVHELRDEGEVLTGLAVTIGDERLLLRRCGARVHAAHERLDGERVTRLAALDDPGSGPGSGAAAWCCIEGELAPGWHGPCSVAGGGTKEGAPR